MELFNEIREKLVKVVNANEEMALTTKAYNGCLRRKQNAIKYLRELAEAEAQLGLDLCDEYFQECSLKVFSEKMATADFVSDVYNGDFLKMAYIQNFGKEPYFVYYLTSLRKL